MDELKVPPHNIEAEQSVIGSLLIDKETVSQVIKVVKSEDFYREEHRPIMQAIYDLSIKNSPIDIVSVAEELKNINKLEFVGGISYLARLADSVPNSANAEYYAKTVKVKSLMRQLIQAGVEISELGFNEAIDIDTLIDVAKQKISFISQGKYVEDKPPTLQTAISFDDVKNMVNAKIFHTHFPTLNRAARLTAGELWSIIGDTSRGKTIFAVNLIDDVINMNGIVLYVALDMTPMQLLSRFISMKRSIPLNDLKPDDPNFSQYVMSELGEDYLKQIYFYDESYIFEDVMSVASAVKPDLLIVDYVQNFETKERYANESIMLSNIMKRLQLVTHEFPIIIISQVSKGEEGAFMKRAKGSSTIAQASSLVIEVDKVDDVFKYKVVKNRTWGLTSDWVFLSSLYGRFVEKI
jgi:replicative DNA helicase